MRFWKIVGAIAFVMILLGGATLWRATWEVRNTTLVTTNFATNKLKSTLRVVQITDFHNLPRTEQIEHIVDLTRTADPDLIALTGDLINTTNQTLEPITKLVSELRTLDVAMYYVAGNHDHWAKDYSQLVEILQTHGVQILSNEHVELTGPWGELTLIGVDDYFSGHGDLATAVQGAGTNFRFVITHSPEILPDLDRFAIDYAICGHTHGGQIRLPFIGAIYQPTGQWFPNISKGLYREGKSSLYIDSGVGVTGPPIRLFNQSAITLHVIGS